MRQLLHISLLISLCVIVLKTSAQMYQPWPAYGSSIPQPSPHSNRYQPDPPLRLLAYTHCRYNGATFKAGDSTVYIYTSGDIWDSALNIWKFSSALQHDDDARGDFVLNPEIRTIHSYNGSGQVDTLRRELLTGNGSTLLDLAVFIYQNNRLVSMGVGVQPRYLTNFYAKEYYYTYDVLGRLTGLMTEDIGASINNAVKREFAYDSAGNVIEECFLTGHKNGNIAALMPIDSIHHTYLNGRLSASFTRRKNSSGLFLDHKHQIYLYDSSGRQIKDYTLEWNYFKSSAWDTMIESTYVYDTAGNNTVATIVSRYQYAIPRRFHKTHNAHGQILTNRCEVWDSTALTWQYDENYSYEERFHYGIYNLGLSEKRDPNTTINIYPVPTSNKLTIDIATKEKRLYITISTLEGRHVRTWNQPLFGNHYKETVDISGIPTGNYILQVQSAGGQITKQFSILR